MSEQDREDRPPAPLSEFSPGGSAVVVPQHPQSKIASPPVIDVAKVNPWTVVPIYEKAAECQDEDPQAAEWVPSYLLRMRVDTAVSTADPNKTAIFL